MIPYLRHQGLVLIAAVVLPIFGVAQTHKINSLRQVYYHATNDRDRLNVLLDILKESETLHTDTLFDYSLRAAALSSRLHDQQAGSWAILAEANAYLRWENIDSARALIESQLPKYTAEDASTRDIYFKLVQARIDLQDDTYNFKDGMSDVYNVLKEAEKYNDTLVIAESMNTLGAWNYDMDFTNEAKRWYYSSLTHTRDDPKFYPILASVNINLGDFYWYLDKVDSAIFCTRRGIEYAKKMENLRYLSVGMQKLAAIDVSRKKYAEAEQEILQSIQLIRQVDGDAPQKDKLIVMASVYSHSGQVDKAIQVMLDGMTRDSVWHSHLLHGSHRDNGKNLQNVFYYDALARYYKQKGDSKNYEATLEKIIDGKDEFYKANSAKAMAELQTKYEVQKKEATIASQRLDLIKHQYLSYTSIVVIVLLGVIGWLVYKNLKRRTTQAVAAAEDTERRRIAADLHDNLGAQLSFIKRNVNFILDKPGSFSPQEEKKYLGYVNDTAQTAIIDLRETIWVLNRDEVEIQEFSDKLKSYLRQQLVGKDSIRWDYRENIGASWKLPSGEVMHLFRIVQELISNTVKHSGADHLDILLESPGAGAYKLEVKDNGKGFDVNGKFEGHYGMENIQQRARSIQASILVKSQPLGGTRVLLIKQQNNTFELLDTADSPHTFTT